MKKETETRKFNRLIHERSPYLLQHAHNPVDWYPWGVEAFDKAVAENKPVFVSIGYSSCHWCHVMEEECFSDLEVADLMNMVFVSIKVDREERPDIDGVYMAVCQHMGRSCGWPLNIVMTPRKNPFFATSYVPKKSRFGLVGMMDLIPQIEQLWKTRSTDLENLGIDLLHSLGKKEEEISESELGIEVLESAFEWFSQNFDSENGGFDGVPKFPSPHNLLFLLRYWNRTKDERALNMVEKTLSAMSRGGIFDQIGFGFHRYSTDEEWLVPHFEKMLYDQALLTLAYVEAYQASGNDEFKTIAVKVLNYVVRDLLSPEGGFYSAQDADSDGEEGKFYLWGYEEVKKVLSPEDSNFVSKVFDVQPIGNYTSGNDQKGMNILHFEKEPEEVAEELGIDVKEFNHKLEKIRNELFEIRKKRFSILTDDKVLADWNGLVIAALAKASQVFADPKYLITAVKTASFILNQMRDGKTIFHSYTRGKGEIEGFLDDYAFLVWGMIEIYEANFDEEILQSAVNLTNIMVNKFWDEKNGGFYFTSKSDKDTLLKRKDLYDGALPSGNSVALLNLLRLGLLTASASFEDMASRMLKVFANEVKRTPAAHSLLLSGLDFIIGPTFNIVLVGDPQEKETPEILCTLRNLYLPNSVYSWRKPSLTDGGYEKVEDKVTAYVCRNQVCMPPTNDLSKILELLQPF